MRNCRHRFHKILFPAGALALLTGALLTLLLAPGPVAAYLPNDAIGPATLAPTARSAQQPGDLGNPTNLQAAPDGAGQVSLTWQPAQDAEIHYVWSVQPDGNGGKWTTAAATAGSATIDGLSSGQLYWFIVLAGGHVDGAWQWSQYSNWASATPVTPVSAAPPVSVTELNHWSWLAQNKPRFADQIRRLSWIADGVDTTEHSAAEALIASARWYPEVFNTLLTMSWVADDVTADEAIAIVRIRFAARYAPALADRILEKPWFQDGITRDEARVIYYLYWTIRAEDESLRQAVIQKTLEILAMPFLDSVESADALAVRSLETLEDAGSAGFIQIMSHPNLSDGITDEEAKIVLLLGGIYKNNPSLIDILLDPDRVTVEERAVVLPLSGQVDLAIIRTATGPPRSMDLLEHGLRRAEGFMGASLPTNHVALLFEEAASVSAAGTHMGTHIVVRPKYDVDDASREAQRTGRLIAHETAHYYWSGNQKWINEGGANFISHISENDRIGAPIESNRYPCAYASGIAELETLDVVVGAEEFSCNYSLGDRLFLDLYQTLGDSDFRQGFRSLYQASQVLDEDLRTTSLGIDHVRDAFQSNRTVVNSIIARWYDGAAPYDLTSLDTDPVDASLPRIGGRITDAFVFLDPDRPEETRTERFSAADLDGRPNIFLRFTFPATAAPKVQPLEFVEYYEDGFVFRRRSRTAVFQPDWTGGRWRVPIGLSSTEHRWATGRYWVYVYDDGRKVAEVTYEVTP